MHNTLVHALEGPGTKAGTQKKAPAQAGPPAFFLGPGLGPRPLQSWLLYASAAADEGDGVEHGGRGSHT